MAEELDKINQLFEQQDIEETSLKQSEEALWDGITAPDADDLTPSVENDQSADSNEHAEGETPAQKTKDKPLQSVDKLFLDESGDMLVAANDMRIMELIPDDYLQKNADALQEADAVLCDANPPADRIAQLADLAGGTPIFADPVSVAKGSISG